MPDYNIKIDSEEDASNTENLLNALLQTNVVEKIYFTRVDNKTNIHFTMNKKPATFSLGLTLGIIVGFIATIISHLLTRTSP